MLTYYLLIFLLNGYIQRLDCTKCSYSFIVNEMDPADCPCLFDSSSEQRGREKTLDGSSKTWTPVGSLSENDENDLTQDDMSIQLNDHTINRKSNSIRHHHSHSASFATQEKVQHLEEQLRELQKQYESMFKQIKELEITMYKESMHNLELKAIVQSQEQNLKDYRFITERIKVNQDKYDFRLEQTQVDVRTERDRVSAALEQIGDTLRKHEDYLLQHLDLITSQPEQNGHNHASQRRGMVDRDGAEFLREDITLSSHIKRGGDGRKNIEVQSAPEALCDGISRNATKYRDCDELFERGHQVSGVYYISLDYTPCPIPVYCDMRPPDDTAVVGEEDEKEAKNDGDPGGWVVIHRRMDGTQNFNRNWTDYRRGFGDLNGEFWLGNDNIFLLSNQASYKLRIDLWDFNITHSYAEYRYFKIGGERDKYRLLVLNHTGPLPDGLSRHSGSLFSTLDEDNDSWPEHHCAKEWNGGWWFDRCWFVFLNGLYFNQPDVKFMGIAWNHWKTQQLKRAEMKVKPSDYI